MLVPSIADYGQGDLAFAEVAQRIKFYLPDAEPVLTPVPSFATITAGFCQNSEMQALLNTPVPLEQTERWIVEYLSDTTKTEQLKLLAAIGNVLIADNDVSETDHDLLDEYHTLMARIPA